MRINGPDDPVFGVDDLEGSITYLTDFGPKPVQLDASGWLFETLDGTGVIIRPKGGPKLPAPNELGVTDNMPVPPRSLSHVVLFVPGMDKHDDTWVAPEAPNSPEARQMFLLQWREKWAPAAAPRAVREAHLARHERRAAAGSAIGTAFPRVPPAASCP